MRTSIASVAILTDCDDKNARARQSVRAQALFNLSPFIMGVTSELDAAGQIIDILDAANGVAAASSDHSIILANIAPRSGDVQKHEKNGVKFEWCRIGGALVLSTRGGTLSLAHKLGLVERTNVLDIPTCMEWAKSQGLVDEEIAVWITETQFRSYEFLPRVARWLIDGKAVPSTDTALHHVFDDRPRVWMVDKFGNVKTTIPIDVRSTDTPCLPLDLPYYRNLSKVPQDGKPAWVIGSSGYGHLRFAEIVINGGNAGKYMKRKVGDLL